VTATSREDNLVTVKLDRDVVARLAALKVAHGRRSYSEVNPRPPPYKVVLLLKSLKTDIFIYSGPPSYSLSHFGGSDMSRLATFLIAVLDAIRALFSPASPPDPLAPRDPGTPAAPSPARSSPTVRSYILDGHTPQDRAGARTTDQRLRSRRADLLHAPVSWRLLPRQGRAGRRFREGGGVIEDLLDLAPIAAPLVTLAIGYLTGSLVYRRVKAAFGETVDLLTTIRGRLGGRRDHGR